MDEFQSSLGISLPRWSKRIGASDASLIAAEWVMTARPQQYPLFDDKPDTWLVIGGRGSGKTRLGAEWVNAMVRGFPPFAELGDRHGQIALVGETLGDVREVMIDGPSGLVTIARHDRPRFEATRRRLVWDNGAVAQIFSSEDPESLRGPQFAAAWCDEVAKWKNADAVFDMLQFGLRLGNRPRQILTTTPKPTPLMKRLLADPTIAVTRMKTSDNADNLAPSFMATMNRLYGGTRLGRQELEGELIEDRADALWTRALLEGARRPVGEIGRIVVAVDPPAGGQGKGNRCGIVAAGLDAEGHAVVLADATVSGVGPNQWAAAVVQLYAKLDADCIVAEVNQGGAMVESVLRAVDADVPVKPVRAKRGKWLRAEPVAALYAQGRVIHAERFPELEDEMCDFGADGLADGRSPDRVDALVWAISELTAAESAAPRIRQMR
ncbi:DNA-packaging protein [Tianweitania sp. BSSL-BM11]|uniref:DNA-packaging protein n=1 Tax=Tianweitania aestuarii TaxID=2814886 RepID=A0ABS5RS54_9HYPH|nr:DNA-packaging protein [Tianweitania aestuarii]